MKKIVSCLLGCGLAWLCFSGCSHPPSEAAAWLTSVPDAEAQAKKENKLVLLNFTGSDWCINCKDLDHEVFEKQEFVDYAKSNLVLVELDYPASKKLPDALVKANDALKDKYKIEGYPTLIALQADGRSVWTNLGYPGGGPAPIIAKLEDAKKK